MGDIQLYLKDQENVYLAKPENVKSISSKMKQIMENSKFSEMVGINGRKVAEGVFDYRNYAFCMNKFIKDVLANPNKKFHY